MSRFKRNGRFEYVITGVTNIYTSKHNNEGALSIYTNKEIMKEHYLSKQTLSKYGRVPRYRSDVKDKLLKLLEWFKFARLKLMVYLGEDFLLADYTQQLIYTGKETDNKQANAPYRVKH